MREGVDYSLPLRTHIFIQVGKNKPPTGEMALFSSHNGLTS
jgi:hypothetical protein